MLWPSVQTMDRALHLSRANDFIDRIAKEERTVTQRDIKIIHHIVMTGCFGVSAYAKTARRIYRMSRIIDYFWPHLVEFPAPCRINALMDDFTHWLNHGPLSIQKAFEAHLKLVSIHPFQDGNGRTARLLMNLLLLKQKKPGFVLPDESRSDYCAALRTFQIRGSDCEYFSFMYQLYGDIAEEPPKVTNARAF